MYLTHNRNKLFLVKAHHMHILYSYTINDPIRNESTVMDQFPYHCMILPCDRFIYRELQRRSNQ